MNDINIYNKRMALAMKDKLWFLDKIDDVLKDCYLYDLGCADGEMIRHIAPYYPQSTFIGLDISDEMIGFAKRKQMFDNEKYFNILSDAFEINHDKPVILTLSSVLHEIFTYEKHPEEYLEWVVKKINPDYILIRDMLPMNSIERKPDRIMVKNIALYSDKEQRDMLDEFEQNFGKIEDSQVNVIHFLLKYKYKENWNREVKENYLPLRFYDITTKIFKDYIASYQKSYILPYTKKQIWLDWHINLRDNTHANFILEKKENWENLRNK